MRRRKVAKSNTGEQHVRPSHLCCRSQSPLSAAEATKAEDRQEKQVETALPGTATFNWVVTYHEPEEHMDITTAMNMPVTKEL
jgi:hypothetical protein